MFKIVGARNYPAGTPSVVLKYCTANSLSKSNDIFKIAGLYGASVGDAANVMNIYGYNLEQWPTIWHKALETEVDYPIRMDALFFEESGLILHSAVHPSLPLFLTVYERNKRQVVLVSYEIEKLFGHAGYFIEEEKVVGVHWVSHLPLFAMLTESSALKIVGPDIKAVAEDINSFSSMLSYSMNTHTRFLWKYYSVQRLEGVREMLHVCTFHKPELYKCREVAMFFSASAVTLASISIKNALDQKGLEIGMKIGNASVAIQDPLHSKYLLKPPKTIHDSFKIALQFPRAIAIYTVTEGKMKQKHISKTAEIPLPENLEIVRINSYQSPIIAVMDTSKIVRMYTDAGKFMGFLNLHEVNKKLSGKAESKITNADLLFYHNVNIQAIVLLLNQKMILLSNKYRYEPSLDLTLVDVLAKPVPYCLEYPIIGFEQTSSDSIILCTRQKGYLVHKKAIREVSQGRKKYISLKVKLHTVNEVYPVYHPSLLREYLIFGDIKKLQMILLHLYDELKKREDEGRKDKVLAFLGIPVTDILTNPAEQKKPVQVESRKSEMFDSFMEEERGSPQKIVVPDKHTEERDYARVMDVKDELVQLIQSSPCISLSESERRELISLLANLKEFLGYQKAEDEITQEFLLHMNLSNVHWSLGNRIPVSTMDVALAYHCQNQDWLLKVLLDPVGSYRWEDIKRFGIPLWLKDSQKLKMIVEEVAKEEYRSSKAKDVERVDEVSLWYVAMGKKNVLMNLYKHTQQGEKVHGFLGHNFAEERWKKAASRNAYQLFSQKRYAMAAAFYLLGNWINEAVQVATTHLNDLYLAVTICRLMGEEGKEELKKLYKEFLIDKGMAYEDPWLASLGNWLSGNYIESLNCIGEILKREGPAIKDPADPQLNLFCKEDHVGHMAEEWPFASPLLTGFNESLIVLCRRLEKHYLVTSLARKEGKPNPQKSVGESIFDAFMDEAEDEEKEEAKEEKKEELVLKMDELILKGAQKYSKLRLPYLALQLIRDEPTLMKQSNSTLTIDPTYTEKMTLSILNAVVANILANTTVTACSDRYKEMMQAIGFFRETYGTDVEKMKEIAVEGMRARNCHVELLYWQMREGNIEEAFSLIQRDAVELTEFIMTIVDNPFSCDILGSKEGTQQKMLSVFHCIERLFNLMEVIEDEIEPSPGTSKDLVLEGRLFREKFKLSVPIFKRDLEEGKSSSMTDCFSKMKIQIAFIVYIGLIMLSYGCNRYSRIIELLEQLLLLLESNTVSWKSFIKPKLAKYINKYRKTIIGGKVSDISGAKEAMQCPSEIDKGKGEAFFTLWSRHIIMRKLAYIAKHYQDVYKLDPNKAMFRMRMSDAKDKASINKEGLERLYEKKSYSLFQYLAAQSVEST